MDRQLPYGITKWDFLHATMTKRENLEMEVSLKVGRLPYAIGEKAVHVFD